ncbi:Hypp2739 [Branchiostoma lanceolatum]|uniref:Hypp2739 protein n=1 Tax=Branchiostoma lanceolatum TaxID=7740 RepID=A0A8J9ZU56_BRALA|nr:Hypp2739 [Branchiostoma lanceolatum]
MSTGKKNFGRRRREKHRAATRTDEDRSPDQSPDQQPYPTPWTERVATEKRQRVYQQQNNIVRKEHEKTLQNIRRQRRTFKKDMRKAMALLRESLSKITTKEERPGKSRGRQKFVHFPQLSRTATSESSVSRHAGQTKLPTVVDGETQRQRSDSMEEQKPSKEDRSLPMLKKWAETSIVLPPESRVQQSNNTSFPQVGKRDSQVFITSIASGQNITSALENSGKNKPYKGTSMFKETPSKADQILLHTVIEEETDSTVNDESDDGDVDVNIVASTDESSVPPIAEEKARCRTWPGEGPVEMFPASGYTSDMMSRLLQNGVMYTYRPLTQAPQWPEPDPSTRLKAASLRSDALIRAGKDGGGIRAWLGLGSEQELNPARKPSVGQRRKSIVQLRRESRWSLDNYEYHST